MHVISNQRNIKLDLRKFYIYVRHFTTCDVGSLPLQRCVQDPDAKDLELELPTTMLSYTVHLLPPVTLPSDK